MKKIALWSVVAAFSLTVVCAVTAQNTTASRFTNGYWERGWPMGQAAVSYQLSLKVADFDDASAKIERVLTAGGATSIGNVNNFQGYFGNKQRPLRQLTYSVPLEKAERLTKKLFDLGDLQSYNVNRFGDASTLKEIDERIALLKGEIDGNKAALAKMPIADYFLQSQLTRLVAARTSYTANAKKGMISIQLIGSDPN